MKKQTCIILTCLLAGVLHAERQIEDTQKFQREGSALTLYSGTIELPAEGWWSVDASVDAELAKHCYGEAEEAALRQFEGRRMGEVLLEKKIKSGRYRVQGIVWACGDYARTNANTGPVTVSDLGSEQHSYRVQNFVEFPWKDVPAHKQEGPYAYLVPSVPYEFSDTEQRSWPTNKALVAFELRPYLDDGKHWVSYTDGTCQREDIDAEQLAKYGQVVRPVYTRKELNPGAHEEFAYTFMMATAGTDPVTLPLTNTYTGASMTLGWSLADATPGDDSLARTFREYQSREWNAYWQYSKSPVLGAWIASSGQVDGLRDPRQRRGETTTAFGVMGGYAAVRETLQMQVISGNGATGDKTVPIESIEGVKVESHPYEEMLGDHPGGQLALAELVPADRFFVYLSKPESMLPLLNEGADFISGLGSAQTGNSIKYYLKKRYLKRLGMDEKWLELFLRSGGVAECALMAPDMFFIDGTDITVVARLAKPELVTPLLKMLGVPKLSDGIAEVKTADGQSVYWCVRGDLLMSGTSRPELQQVLALAAKNGEGSLGQSAEFRYMLTQLPLSEQTRAFAYCSDAFIRRLVGPATKIGQRRRVEVMARLQRISAAALLARLDGVTDVGSLDTLKTLGYLPEAFSTEGYSLDSDLTAHSATYGTLASLKSLSAVPVERATDEEAKAYKIYVQNYSRFWRQFFDPIALRLDDTSDGALEATLFILPLIDSSIYNGIKEVVASREDGLPLKTPRMSPEPVLQFSVNLKEKAWVGVSEGFSDMLMQYVMIDPAILDDLGSGLHLMIHDADPVIALGSGDLLGGFGGNVLGDEAAFFIPIVASILTRPCTLAIETGNPERTATYLRNAADSFAREGGWNSFTTEIYQVGDADSWVCMLDIMGMVRLRYGFEVRDGFLLIRNIPWSNKDTIVSVETAALNAASLKAFPDAGKLQLAGLHSTAAEKSRAAALQGMGLLFPLIKSGEMSVAEAGMLHLKLFGYTPYQPADDNWSWTEGMLESELYGSVANKKQPAYTTGDTSFGLMEAIESLEVQTQFEDTGLRARFRWKTR